MEQKATKKGFGSKIGFILAATGSAIGLGNIWRFPYLVAKYGGGAFVLVYLLSIAIIGSVVMIAEMYIGKRAKTNNADAYGKTNKWLKWVGLLSIAVPFLIACYYVVIGGWSTKYVFNYAFLPNFLQGTTSEIAFTNFITDKISPIFYMTIFLIISIFIVCGGVEKGIEKASKILMPILFILLIIVVIKALTLGSGVKEGIKFYVGTVDFAKLGWKGAVTALGQGFFSLSLGMGVMVAYGSYSNSKTNLGKSALAVCILDTFIALFAGFAIFPTMFALGNGPALAETAGAGLIFIVLPQLFESMSGGHIFAIMFFMLITFAAITSVISLIEVVSQYTISRYKLSRKKATVYIGSIIGFIAIFISLSQGAVNYTIFGYDFLTYLDELTNILIMPLGAIFSCIAVGWCIKPKSVFEELGAMQSKFKGQNLWMFMLRFITPLLILFILIMGIIDKFAWAKENGLNYVYVLLGGLIMLIVTLLINYRLNKMSINQQEIDKPLE